MMNASKFLLNVSIIYYTVHVLWTCTLGSSFEDLSGRQIIYMYDSRQWLKQLYIMRSPKVPILICKTEILDA